MKNSELHQKIKEIEFRLENEHMNSACEKSALRYCSKTNQSLFYELGFLLSQFMDHLHGQDKESALILSLYAYCKDTITKEDEEIIQSFIHMIKSRFASSETVEA